MVLAFLTVPAYSFFLSLRNHAPLKRKETVSVIPAGLRHRSNTSTVLARRRIVHRLGVQPLHRYQVSQPERYSRGCWWRGGWLRCQYVRTILQRQRIRRYGECHRRCPSICSDEPAVDHWHPVPTAFWVGKWWFVLICNGGDGWDVIKRVLPLGVLYRPATRLCVHRSYRWTRCFSYPRASRQIAS